MAITTRRGARCVAAVALTLGAAVPVAGCGGIAAGGTGAGDGSRPVTAAKAPRDAGARAVTMPDLSFAPRTTTVRAGQSVTWRNTSKVTHNVKGPGFFSRVIEPGATYRHWFAKPGRYAYVCTFHPGMRGTVVVR
jgi:plastocyanin